MTQALFIEMNRQGLQSFYLERNFRMAVWYVEQSTGYNLVFYRDIGGGFSGPTDGWLFLSNYLSGKLILRFRVKYPIKVIN